MATEVRVPAKVGVADTTGAGSDALGAIVSHIFGGTDQDRRTTNIVKGGGG